MENEKIYLSPPFVGREEKAAVLAALEAGWVAPAGPDLEAFEREVADAAGRGFGVGVASGTAALHLSLISLGVKPGDVVLCPTMTFVATANAIRYLGAEPVFVDSDSFSGNVSTALLEQAILHLRSVGANLRGVIAVDFLGKCANYGEIVRLCDDFNLFLLSDSAESIGASCDGRPAGSFGEMAIFSFNGNKIITTSGGGMVVTDDQGLADRVRFLSTQAREAGIHYEHRELGYNYRLSNILAALGRVQLEKLSDFKEKRRETRLRYRALFKGVEGVVVFGEPDERDNFWLTSIVVEEQSAGWKARDLQEHLESNQIESRPLWKPMHLQPLYRSCLAFIDGSSEQLFGSGLALPSGTGLDDGQWERIQQSISTFLEAKV